MATAAATGRSRRSFHGVTVDDPHAWLDDLDAAPARDWVEAQDRATTEFFAQCPGLARAQAFLARNFATPDPVWDAQRGARRFALARRPGLAQLVLVVQEGGAERVLLDPNPDGRALATDEVRVSPTGRYITVSTAPAGEILGTLQVLDAATGAVLESADFRTVMPVVAWHPREHGFWYSLCRRLFGDGEGRRDGLYWHALGTPWSADRCIKEYHDGPGHIAHAAVAGGRWLVVATRQFSSSMTGVELSPLPDDPAATAAPPVRLFADLEGYIEFLGAAGGELYFHTCVDAPNGRVVAVDPRRAARRDWRTVVPETDLALARPERFGGPPKAAVSEHGLLLTYVEHAHDVLRHFGLDGRPRGGFEPPELSTVDGVFVTGSGFRIHTQSFLVPAAAHDYDAATGAVREVARSALPDVDPADYELRQEFCRGRDGERIPLYLLHRRGLARDGTAPTLLYGYGGFGQSITPEYSPSVSAWLALGGVYAVANIRGGGEYGERWHRAGSGLSKQNTFDDFYAAAGHLIAQGYTSAERLVARGLSNGGLLTAVAAHQRPELFAAVVSEIPLVDMLGLDDSSTGQAVAAEYGSPSASREAFELLRAYSPLHNARPGRTPAQLVVVADRDASAPPPQAYKYVAARQQAVAGSAEYAPVLLRVVRGEGHTGWQPESTRRVLAEEIAFLHHFATAGAAAALRQQLDLRVPMRDGVTLSANVWLPAAPGRHPAVLLRTPYANDAAQFERLGLRAYAEAGYAVVFQSVRGRGGSGGRFDFMFPEGADGYDSVEWVAVQLWCDGRVAMDGGSYLGSAQWLAARERPPHLACILPAVPAGDWFHEIPYTGGALQVDWAFCWLGAMAGLSFDFTAAGHRNLEAFRPLAQAERVLGAELPRYREILAHPTADAWWRPLQMLPEDFARFELPVFTVTGWFDGDQAGTLHYWQGIERHGPRKERARLVIGPWEHAQCYLGGDAVLRELAPGPDSVLPLRELRLAFLDEHLRGRAAPPQPRVRLFVTGSNRWHHFAQYPPPRTTPQKWFLRSGGAANTASGDGVLSPSGPGGPPDRYRFDPADPVPYKPGAADHRELETRPDVLVYTGEALREPLTVIGAVEAVIFAASSAPDTDFTAKLLDLHPDGRAVSLTHVGGVLRARYRNGFEALALLRPGEPAELRIRLSHVGHTFLPGHRLRLEVSSSNFPLADPNPNTGTDIATETRIEVAEQTVLHDAAHPSHLLLPVLPDQGDGHL